MPRRTVGVYLLVLLAFFSFFIAVSNVQHLVNKADGVPKDIAEAFPGMEIRDGKLYPPTDTPYVPPMYLILSIIRKMAGNQLFALPEIMSIEADSMVVVDTAEVPRLRLKAPVMVLKADRIAMVIDAVRRMEFPYDWLMSGEQDLDFTVEGIHEFLMGKVLSWFFGYFIIAIFVQTGKFLASIFFLAFAAYIFRLERQRTLKDFLRISCFAISPIALGSALVAIANVNFIWTSHVMILLATVVMFRAILAVTISNQESKGV